MTQKNWRYATNADDWFRSTEKRLMHEERRPMVREASSLLGPGFDQYAIQTFDWNATDCMSNGYFYSAAYQVQNSPDNNLDWMGITEGTSDGNGIQTVWQYKTGSDADPIVQYSRRFWSSGGVTNYGAWHQSATGGGGGGSITQIGAAMYRTTAHSVANNVGTPMNFGSIAYENPAGMCSIGTEEITIPEDGIYLVEAYVQFESGDPNSGTRTIYIEVDGVATRYSREWATSGNVSSFAQASMTKPFVAGTKITATLMQTQGATLATTAAGDGRTYWLSVTKVTGAKGDKGDPGPSQTVAYTFVQGTPVNTWVIDHPLTFLPNVTVVDSSGRQVEGDVSYADTDTVTITFSAAFSGKAYLS
jgi:hypothetical protein